MGVLDDAIREHLELKRKHGAPEQEVTQQEQEALGPPVRQPVEQAAEPAAGAPEEQAAAAYPASAAEPVADDPLAEETVVAEPSEEELVADEPVADPMQTDLETPAVSEPGPRDDELLHDPIDEAFAEPAAEEPVEDAGEHDVLEETPDFLEETPEHDRLWFEQKPPRDFDFDE